jgi:exosome complex component MTR3
MNYEEYVSIFIHSPSAPLNMLTLTRCIDLRTGLTPSASGSAYLEVTASPSLTSHTSGLKITCTVHGPRPLPRSAPFTPQLLLTSHIKFAPFASRLRRGYIRDFSERDLSTHLETALRGAIIGERWPKSGVEVILTVLEGEENEPGADVPWVASDGSSFAMLNVLAGCITVASAAIVDAGIDCLDLISGGVAALVRSSDPGKTYEIVLDPSPSEHAAVLAACVVGYLPSRDEVTELWLKGDIPNADIPETSNPFSDALVDGAVEAALAARLVLSAAVVESADFKLKAVLS